MPQNRCPLGTDERTKYEFHEYFVYLFIMWGLYGYKWSLFQRSGEIELIERPLRISADFDDILRCLLK